MTIRPPDEADLVSADASGSDAASRAESAHSAKRRRLARYAVRATAISIPLLFLALLAFGVLAQSPSTTIDDSLGRGQAIPAPAFSLALLRHGDLGPALDARLVGALRGVRLSSRELRGVPVVLNFWASWCIPCAQEAPLLERSWRAQARPRGVLFLGLNMQDITSDADNFMNRFGVDYLNIRDPSNDVARSYGVTGLPETFFIGRSGQVVGHVIGESSAVQLRTGIAAALSGQVAGARHGGARRPTG